MNGTLRELYTWSKDLPDWQSHALRKIIDSGDTPPHEIPELAIMAAPEAFPDNPKPTPIPLAKAGAESPAASNKLIQLISISNTKNVNAIPDGQELSFGEAGLTVVYGDNGSGKSGYTRILKRVCSARDEVDNVLSNAHNETQDIPSATINYSVNGEHADIEWKEGEAKASPLMALSVFDSRCANVYVESDHSISYLPHGFDAPRQLAVTSDEVKAYLKREAARINTTAHHIFEDIEIVGEIGNIIHAFEAGNLRLGNRLLALANISQAEEDRRKSLGRVLQAKNPASEAKTLKAFLLRLQSTTSQQIKFYRPLETERIDNLKVICREAAKHRHESSEAAKLLSNEGANLPGTGTSQAWRALFESARRYMTDDLGQPIHACTPADICPLCQQQLGDSGSSRIKAFHEFLQKDINQKADASEEKVMRAKDFLSSDQQRVALFDAQLLDGIARYDSELAATLEQEQQQRNTAFDLMISAINTGDWSLLTDAKPATARLRQIEKLVEAEIIELNRAEEDRAPIEAEFQTLSIKAKLSSRKPGLESVIKNRNRVELLQRKANEINTAPITRMVRNLLESTVTPELKAAISDELHKLRLTDHVIDLKCSSRKGLPTQKIQLSTAQPVPSSKILSEGEQRAIAIACFLAELSVNPDSFGIILDDPVTSLDHERREEIATRLVEEAKRRQVIVFTHDLYFLQLLRSDSESEGVQFTPRSVYKINNIPGQISSEYPFSGKSSKQRVGQIKQLLQAAEAKGNSGDIEALQREGEFCYKQMRETWEQAIEDLVLSGAIKRFSNHISIDKFTAAVRDIKPEDLEIINKSYETCCYFVHNRPAAGGNRIIKIEQLRQEVDNLAVFVTDMNRRRN